MCAAFSGFVAGRIVGLQEFGLGLAVAIFVDATIVRSLLVPSMMAILGRWNWWLPAAARAGRPRRALAARAARPARRSAAPAARHTLSEHAGNESAIGGRDHLCMRYLAAIIGMFATVVLLLPH